jgi:predicted cupin superfamily sugar epimerase
MPGAEAMPGDAGYALVGCVVAPGFDFADFEMVGDA